jgi:ppGpp synthetase/RelA/SpoT-type nucleotidyltranferase
MNIDRNKIDSLCDEYESKRQLYKEFCDKIAEIIRQVLLNDPDIKTYSISSREKNIEKLREKIERKQAENTIYLTLDDIEDLAGVRVVTYLESHREKAINLIYSEFESSCVRVENKYDPEGYRGTHLVLRLGDDREKLTEYARYAGLKCEVQISSILYHAWSEIEHDVIYKPGADREKLKSLGLDDIEGSFHKIMAQHLEEATIQFDLLHKKHKEVLAAGEVIYSDFVSDIRDAQSNDEIFSILDIGDKFAHKKPEEALLMAEEAIKRLPLDTQVIGQFGKRNICGKTHTDILEKSIEIFSHTRYWDVRRALSSLFSLAIHSSEVIAKEAMKAVRATAKYNHTFLKRHKNLYPQRAALDYIREIPQGDQKKFMIPIAAVIDEILSISIEGTVWNNADQFTFRSDALVPNKSVKKIRREAMDFVVKLYTPTLSTKERVSLVDVLLTALETPHNVAYGDDLVEMVREDATYLANTLSGLLLSKGRVIDYLVAQQVEKALIRVLRSERLKNDAAQELYGKLQSDADYATFCTLVGDIHEYRNLDEDWHEAEKRRREEIKALVTKASASNLDKWYTRLNEYAHPLKDGAVDEWKFQSFRVFISNLTETKPKLATALFTKAIQENAPLSRATFVMPYLATLRRKNNFASWDAYVDLICKKKADHLTTAVVISLNLDEGLDLAVSIRERDIDILEQIVTTQSPFAFTRNAGFELRHALINTLARIFERDRARIEMLIVREMKGNTEYLNVYFTELPFASGRKWMSFKDWSQNGIAFLREQLVELPNLDWHVQEMMLELVDDPIELILGVFKARIQRDEEESGGRYEEVPYHFNPDLQRYLAEHPRYVDEIVKWLRDMTPDWSSYNWHVSHFIQRIGGASYTTVLMKLIEASDDESLEKAAYALNDSDGADFTLCFEIVKRTDNKDILNRVSSAMDGTGVVSGEHGLARAYEGKAKALEEYITSKDKRVRTFATEMKKHFEAMAQNELERSTIRQKRRRLEFEG